MPSREKAKKVLDVWMDRERFSATVQRLARALKAIGKNDIELKLQGTYAIPFLLILTIISQLEKQ